MYHFLPHDISESARSTGQVFGSIARSFWSHPGFAATPLAVPEFLAACGEVTERSFSRMSSRPCWRIATTRSEGTEYPVVREVMIDKPFCDLVGFRPVGRPPAGRRLLLIAPMSGHYPTLLRNTVDSLLPDCEVFLTEWRNARDVPVRDGTFDIEDFTRYLIEFIEFLGPDIHVVAICQPAPLALAATAEIAGRSPGLQPRSLVLMGGPVVPGAAPTTVTEFANRLTAGQLESMTIQRVGGRHPARGRRVYPGLLQLAFFMMMKPEQHLMSFAGQMTRIAGGRAREDDRHNRFYDEYQAVMDLPAEFYLSTVERLFRNAEIARNIFTLDGRRVDITAISSTSVMTVEGGRDDISAPGQSSAILPMLTGLPDDVKVSHVEPDAGHYGIFAGKSWRTGILPKLLDFVDGTAPAPGHHLH